MLFRYDSALSGLFGRIVIMEQLLQMTKYTEVIGYQVWWVGWVWQLFQSTVLYYSLRNKNKVQRWWQDQAGLWVAPGEHATRILFDWHQTAFW